MSGCPEVQEIESLIQRNLQESFPRARFAWRFLRRNLRSLLDEAQIAVNDGISGPFKTKGDGLRRSVAFAILRAYVDLKTLRPARADSPSSRPCSCSRSLRCSCTRRRSASCSRP